jgi:hypothetical protein
MNILILAFLAAFITLCAGILTILDHIAHSYRAYVKHWRRINKDEHYDEF